MLGWYVRRLAEGGLVAALTATSPARLPHPEGGEPLAGTNPLAIAIPSSDGKPLVTDVSMGAVTYGDVLRGAAQPEELVPFGGEQSHKAFALALGLQLFVDALAGEGYGAVLVVAPPGDRSGRRLCAHAQPGYDFPATPADMRRREPGREGLGCARHGLHPLGIDLSRNRAGRRDDPAALRRGLALHRRRRR